MTLYLKNATFIDWETLSFKECHLAVSTLDEKQIEILTDLPESGQLEAHDEILDCSGKLVTRSFGCGHHHIYSTFARGMPAPGKTPENFLEILKYIWWNLDKKLDLEMIKASALAAGLYCAKNGVTFVIDHHASPFAVRGALGAIRESFDAVGISHLLCYEISDRDGEQSNREGFEETEAYLKSGFQGLVGLHASFTVGNQTLEKAVELAKTYDTGIHVHVAEGQADQEACLKVHNQRVLERFHQAGVLDLPASLLVHCVHLGENEIKFLNQGSAWVVENIESNLNNNVGLADYSRYGDRVMLGTDGMHSDMLRSAKAAFFVGQTSDRIDFGGAYHRFRNIHRYLKQNGFSGDGDNNLVVLDYDPPTEVHAENFVGHLLFGLESRHVSDLISNGRLIVKEGKLQTIDEQDILLYAREMGNRLWEKL